MYANDIKSRNIIEMNSIHFEQNFFNKAVLEFKTAVIC